MLKAISPRVVSSTFTRLSYVSRIRLSSSTTSHLKGGWEKKDHHQHCTSSYIHTCRSFSTGTNSNDTKDNNNNKINNESDKEMEPKEPIIDFDDGIDSYTRKLMHNRHQGITMNKDGLSQHVLPGEYIVKTNQKTGDKKMVGLERSMGYFWELKVS